MISIVGDVQLVATLERSSSLTIPGHIDRGFFLAKPLIVSNFNPSSFAKFLDEVRLEGHP